ncbi:MAG: hypothetical protein QOH60_5087 [Mycobacterium sp.]|jgi:hypothetical protein|nr:hypothetical protein [Mycobacterium sp.]
MYVGVVVNPFARKNRGNPGDRTAKLRRVLGRWGEVHETRSLDELRAVVSSLDTRVTHLVSDGGDGSLNWLINEMHSHISDPALWPTFVPTSGGTIDFVARKARIGGRAEAIVGALAASAETGGSPREVTLDSLELCGETVDGTTFHRVGFALAAGGVGNRFFDAYYRDRDPGRATIVRVIVRAVGDYVLAKAVGKGSGGRRYAEELFNPTRARVAIDGVEVPTRHHTALHAGAFDVNLGGVVRLFPKAREPGALHFQAGELPPAKMIAQLPALIAGRGIRGDRLCDVEGREMIIVAQDEPLSPIIDGERFAAIVHLVVRAGPGVRIARIG